MITVAAQRLEVLAKFIRGARQSRGWTRYTLADLAGVAEGDLAAWEAGIVFPTPDQLDKVSQALGESVQYLRLLAGL